MNAKTELLTKTSKWIYLKTNEADYWLAKHLGYKPRKESNDIQISPKQLATLKEREKKLKRPDQYRYLANCLVQRFKNKFPITKLEAEQEIWDWGNRFYLESGCWVSGEYSCREVMEEVSEKLSHRKSLKKTRKETDYEWWLKLNPAGFR